MAFPSTALDLTVEAALGADLTAVPAAWSWTDITDWLYQPAGVVIQRGRLDEFATAPPSKISLTLDNRDGRFCPRNPTGAYYGSLARNTPLRVRVNPGAGYQTRSVGYVDQWPVVWGDKSLSVALAPITASGSLRRLGQGGTQRSALYRYHALQPYTDTQIVGYWPCEDQAGSTTIASGIGGRAANLTGGLEDFGGDAQIAGSDPLMTLTAGVSFVGYCHPYTATGDTAIRAIVKIPAAPAGTVELLRWWTSGSFTVWTVDVVPGSPDRLFLRAYNSLGVEQLAATGVNMEDDGSGVSLYGRQLYLSVDLDETGGGIAWAVRVAHTFAYDAGNSAADSGTEAASTVGTVEAIGSHNHSAAAAGTTLGHIAVATDLNYTAGGSAAATGFAGESVAIRLAELAAELDVSAVGSGVTDPAKKTWIGASSATDIVGLFRELEAAEQGILYDGRLGELELLMREDRYNRAVALTLDHAGGQVDFLAPTDDDQQIVNDVTVSRDGGSQFRAFDPAHIAANGTYAVAVDVLLFQDSDLPYHAAWRLHLGTVDELRYPTVGLCLTRQTGKITDWLACDIGSRIQILNPPAGLPPDTIDLHIEGWTEYLRDRDWRVELNCSPAGPWQVFEVEGSGNAGRLDTSGSALVGAPDTTETALVVVTPGGSLTDPLWSSTAVPYDIAVGGERMTVTAAASSQIDLFTRSASSGWAGGWSIQLGTAANFSVDGAEANIAVNSVAAARVITLPDSFAAGEIYLDKIVIAGGVVAAGASISTALVLRYVDSSNFLLGELLYSTSDTVTARIVSWTAGSPTVVASQLLTGLSGSGTAFAARFAAHGPELYLRVWNRALTEPTGWTVTAHSTGLLAAGQAGVWLMLNTGNTNTLPVTFAYDAAQITNPQVLTVTRSVNGAVKAHPAGTAVSLWKPGVLAL